MRPSRSVDGHEWNRTRFAGLVALLLCGSCAWGCGEPPPAPTLSSQGFDLAQGHETLVGAPSSVRLRIEAPAGLDSLRIRERSYDVDLAQSPEVDHFPLFGLSGRVWSKTDVTLDFGPYVVRKMTVPGDYSFEIVATDRNEESVTAALRVRVLPAEIREPTADPEETDRSPSPPLLGAPSSTRVEPGVGARTALDVGHFRLERVGRGPVVSDDDFGITWKTVESTHVVIRIGPPEGEASRFVRLQPGAFAETDSRERLAEMLAGLPEQPILELATANDSAAGMEVAIVRPTISYLLRTEHSETHLSDRGTTVTLTGRYKR